MLNLHARLGLAIGISLVACCTDDQGIPGEFFDLALSHSAIDAAGLQCSTCVGLVPAGWTGPAALIAGKPGTLPKCPVPYSTELYSGSAGLDASSVADCSCTCGAPVGVTCFWTQVRVINNNNVCTCAPGGCYVVPLSIFSPNTCLTNLSMEPPGEVLSVAFDGAIDGSKGRCAPIVPAPPPSDSWDRKAILCGLDQFGAGECGSNEICVPAYSAPPLSNVCIFRPGDVPCPAGRYAHKALYYDGISDSRGCTACECGEPTGRACSVRVQGFETPQCAPAVIDVTIKSGTPGPGCIAGPNAKYFKESPAVISDVGTCVAKPGKPVGTATPQGPTTVCCED